MAIRAALVPRVVVDESGIRDLVGAVILLGVGQGAILAPALWVRRANQLANRLLAALVVAVALLLLLGHLERLWAFDGHPHLLALGARSRSRSGPWQAV